MPVACEFWAGGTGGNLGVDISPLGPTVSFHVLGGDLVRDALVAQSRNQPIEQRRRGAGWRRECLRLSARRGGRRSDWPRPPGSRHYTPPGQRDRSLTSGDDRGLTGVAEARKSLRGLPLLKSWRQIMAMSLRCTSVSPSMYRWVVGLTGGRRATEHRAKTRRLCAPAGPRG